MPKMKKISVANLHQRSFCGKLRYGKNMCLMDCKEQGKEKIMTEETREITPGNRIIELCEENQISQRELARRIGITPSQISRIIKGETRTINSDILMAVAREFEVSTDYILGVENRKREISGEDTKGGKESKFYTPMLLMSSSFPIGGCIDFIEALQDKDEKKMAYAEYYYFSGQHEKAVAYTECYLDCEDVMLKMSACLIYTFANLSLNHINSARMGLDRLREHLAKVMDEQADIRTRAFGVFVASAAHTLLHLPMGDIPPLSDYIGEFKKGKQLWGAYVLAHRAYLNKEYERSLGIVEVCLMTTKEIYPISMIYLDLVAAIDSMNLMQIEQAKRYFMKAWEIAKPDNLIEGIGEHHGLLQGLIETCLKRDYPEDYQKIIAITYKFSFGWRRIHNPDSKGDVADNLTTTEFTIAMLANRGWSNQEIADYLQITHRTVKQHMTCIFNKLNISNRKQLKDYMLR